MYDAKSEASEFVGETRDEAVNKAVRFFGVEAGELTVSEPAAGSVFGAGARVVVVAQPTGAVGRRSPRDSEDNGRGGRDRDRGDRGRGRDRDDRREARSETRGRGRGRGRDRERDGDRGDRPERGERERRPRGDRDRDRDRVAREAVADSKGAVDGKVGPVGDFLLGVIERMQLGSFEISETRESDFLIYQVRGAAIDALGEIDPRAIDALQLLANQAALRHEDEPPRIVVDAEGDAERRDGFLARLAERAAKRASDTGRSVALDPMNGRDRRILHMTVRELDGVATMSVGEGRYRQVVIIPEGAPDYDEAVRASEAAEARDDD